MIRYFASFLLVGLYLLMANCSTNPQSALFSATQKTLKEAKERDFKRVAYPTQTFILTALEHLPPKPAQQIHVYIEGDGHSWIRKTRLSSNPTPRQPLALTLALEDPHPHVVYLARPCQYTPLEQDKNCSPKYWSSHRYSPEVIQSTNDVLNKIKSKTHSAKFVLIGFSGGASIAALVASQRTDIAALITVAGDLNHEALNAYHGTTPLPASLNPTAVTHLLKKLPQQHWSGGKDKIVPSWVSQAFADKINSPLQVKLFVLKDASHHKGWKEKWADIAKTFSS